MIRDPCHEATTLNQTSKEASKVLVTALVEGTELSLVRHRQAVKEASATARASKKADEEYTVATQKGQANAKEKKRLARILGCGAWLIRPPTRFEGTQVTEEEWHDNLSLQYGMQPVHLPQQCDGCGSNFSVDHAL
jgi:sarcosine oxidase gamma subunit